MSRDIKFEYGFNSVNGIVKKKYYLHEIPNIKEKCDVWNVLPIVYVRQYTGLKDKKGKEIYIGDILSDKWKVEVYQNDEGTFMVKFNTNQKVNKPMSLKKYLKAREKAGTSNCEGYRDCIIIGNIHENPEILKE